MPTRPIVYLAGPYTHPDRRVRLWRYGMITKAAAKLIAGGEIVFSPLTMTHPIDILLAQSKETLGSRYWVDFDEAFMEFCSELRILTLEGWRDSSGIRREIAFFIERGRPVTYLEPGFVDNAKRAFEAV